MAQYHCFTSQGDLVIVFELEMCEGLIFPTGACDKQDLNPGYHGRRPSVLPTELSYNLS